MNEETQQTTPAEIKPCRHMEQHIQALADGSLTGMARWYTQLHVKGCQHCHSALEALQRLQNRFQTLRQKEGNAASPTLSPARRSSLESVLDEVERKRT